jgi:hypothetical protein
MPRPLQKEADACHEAARSIASYSLAELMVNPHVAGLFKDFHEVNRRALEAENAILKQQLGYKNGTATLR